MKEYGALYTPEGEDELYKRSLSNMNEGSLEKLIDSS